MKTSVGSVKVVCDSGENKPIIIRDKNGDLKTNRLMQLIKTNSLVWDERVGRIICELIRDRRQMAKKLKKLEKEFSMLKSGELNMIGGKIIPLDFLKSNELVIKNGEVFQRVIIEVIDIEGLSAEEAEQKISCGEKRRRRLDPEERILSNEPKIGIVPRAGFSDRKHDFTKEELADLQMEMNERM